MYRLPWLPLAAACTPPATGDSVHPGLSEPSDAPADVVATAAPSAWVPSVLGVHWDLAGAGYVAYGLDGDLSSQTPVTDSGGAALLGLKAGRSYSWQVVLTDADGEVHTSAVSTFDVPLPPADLLPFTVDVSEADAELAFFAGTVIRSPDAALGFAGDSYAVVVDRDGDFVWWVSTGGTVSITPKLGYDGRSLAWNQYDFGKEADRGSLVRVAFDGESRSETRLVLGQHDFYQHADGTVAWLGVSFGEVEVGGDTLLMSGDTLSTGPEGMTDATPTTLVFDQLTDFPTSPQLTCKHIAEAGTEFGVDDVHEWTHANSLVYLPETDSYYVNDRYTDWLLKIPAGGGVGWVLGGSASTFVAPSGEPLWRSAEDSALWSHGHLSDLWDGGGLMFDNGDHRDPPHSRVAEFQWDEVAGTAEVTWAFEHPEGAFAPAIGDARRMPGGNVLITWAGVGEVHEVARDGRVVWHATYPPPSPPGGPPGQTLGRLIPIMDLYAPAGGGR